MRKLSFLTTLAFLAATVVSGQTKAEFDTKVQQFKTLYNTGQFDSINGMLSERSKTIIAPEKLKQGMQQLFAQAGVVDSFVQITQNGELAKYRVFFKNITLALNMSMNAEYKLESFRFMPDQPENKKAAVDTSLNNDGETVTLKTSKGVLYGTLTVPATNKQVPAVLIIAGSGPTDRNGNNSMGLKTNAYKLLADSLKNAGIASLRYDKRGVGASAAAMRAEAEVTFIDMVTDAVDFIKLLRADKRFSKVIVAGHSEGSLIGMLAAQKTKVDKFISFAGAGTSADETLKMQMMDKPADIKTRVYSIMDSIKKGYQLNNIPPDMVSMFRPSIQPYLRTWFAFDPQVEIKKIKIPMLIVQGGRDIQVSLSDAKKLKDAAPTATMIVYPAMDHVLKQPSNDPDKKMDTYFDPAYPLFPGMPLYIINFIMK